MNSTLAFTRKDTYMEATNEFTPTDPQAIYRKLERLIGNYRDGQGGTPFYGQIEELSAEWERQDLPCRIEKHGWRDRFANWHS